MLFIEILRNNTVKQNLLIVRIALSVQVFVESHISGIAFYFQFHSHRVVKSQVQHSIWVAFRQLPDSPWPCIDCTNCGIFFSCFKSISVCGMYSLQRTFSFQATCLYHTLPFEQSIHASECENSHNTVYQLSKYP